MTWAHGHSQTKSMSESTRVAQATAYCQQTQLLHKNTSSRYPGMRKLSNCKLYAPSRSAKLCPIAKIASTFWVRLFKILELDHGTEISSPYSYPLLKADSQRCTNASKEPFKASKILSGTFVREPFSRVFSAYVDKLLSPNPILWAAWGKPAMRLDGVPASAVHCGERVTFRQFLRFVTDRLYLQDYHVIPMAAQCDPCKEKFDFIGKIETFSADIHEFMSLLNLTFKDGVQLSQEAREDAVYDSVQGPFSWRGSSEKCVTPDEIGRRIWRKLQIRGMISGRLDYPFGVDELKNMSMKHFLEAAMNASAYSTDKQELSRQKKQAMVEAFRTVTMSDIRKYQETFEDDFKAFGYDMNPSFLFETTGDFVNTNAFDFNAPWKIPE